MHWFRRRQDSAAQLPTQFHTLLACEEYPLLDSVNFDIPVSHFEAYARRVRLYREAAVLLAFVERGADDPKIAPTLGAYEALLMGRVGGVVSRRLGSAVVFWHRPRCKQRSHLEHVCFRMDEPVLGREVECGRGGARAKRGYHLSVLRSEPRKP